MAFNAAFPGETLSVEGVGVDSGVSSHPTNAEESLQGAINRAGRAKEARPDADYYVGIEGGLLEVGDRAWEVSWVAIENKRGHITTALSAGIEVRGKILEAIRGGQELGDVLRNLHEIDDAGKKTGFYGLATDDLITREDACRDAVVFAVSIFKKQEYFA